MFSNYDAKILIIPEKSKGNTFFNTDLTFLFRLEF